MRRDDARFVRNILSWYKTHGRDLPWRQTHDPYKIFVSEVMLQQTQVERVVPKYKEFLKKFPTAKKLAQAQTAEVIQAWRGLGYNRRALFLQRAAQKIQSDFGGRFPRERELLRTLPGVGEYTARAILSFAFLEPVAVLDTNHRKFYQRFFSSKKLLADSQLLTKADEFTAGLGKRSRAEVYAWNQAIMDFMTAVAQENTDSLVQRFTQSYPGNSIQKKLRKKTIPFKKTDRFIRGRIVDALRDSGSLNMEEVRHGMFPDFTADRLERVVINLIKDGLIKRKKQSIVFI